MLLSRTPGGAGAGRGGLSLVLQGGLREQDLAVLRKPLQACAFSCRLPAPGHFLACLARLSLPVTLRGRTAASLQEKELDRNNQNSSPLPVWEELLQMCLSTFCLSEQN